MKIIGLQIGLILLIIFPFYKGFTNSQTKCSTSFINYFEKKDTTVYAYITLIKNDNKGFLIFLDFIQFYSNEEAIVKAKERGDADTLYENGKMIISVPGDYYILNESKIIRKYYLSNNVKIELQLNQDRKHPINENTLNSLIKIHTDSPFKVRISNDKIVAIEEVFMP